MAASLPPPRTSAGRDGLAAVLADPSGCLLACDYDGTLAPIVTDPSTAAPQAGGVGALQALAGVLGGVAVVTGRPASVAVSLGGLDAIPGLVVLGSYGAERWSAGRLESTPAAPLPDTVLAAVDSVVDTSALEGVRVERKGAAVAVHVRTSPDPDAALAALMPRLVAVAHASGLMVEPGRLVVELRRPGSNKGSALRGLVTQRQARSVVFVGDDLGDLAAFAEVDALRSTGRCAGLTVASSSVEAPAVAASADLVVGGPPGVVAFLQALNLAVRGAGA